MYPLLWRRRRRRDNDWRLCPTDPQEQRAFGGMGGILLSCSLIDLMFNWFFFILFFSIENVMPERFTGSALLRTKNASFKLFSSRLFRIILRFFSVFSA